ncbi:unnamed protein product [Protopolystoma xenopodis]|uniref:Uncharacterized protein n=1 Tax=Protopolystoma xenopodis TaxID=117903 RepID=A0A448WRM8_9PLAT|nr:unnamed protein product [Protopolystoma xenopodis]
MFPVSYQHVLTVRTRHSGRFCGTHLALISTVDLLRLASQARIRHLDTVKPSQRLTRCGKEACFAVEIACWKVKETEAQPAREELELCQSRSKSASAPAIADRRNGRGGGSGRVRSHCVVAESMTFQKASSFRAFDAGPTTSRDDDVSCE